MIKIITKEKNKVLLEEKKVIKRNLKEYVSEKGILDTDEVYLIAIKVCEAIRTLKALNPLNIYRSINVSEIIIYENADYLLVSIEALKIREQMYEDYKIYLKNNKFHEEELCLLSNLSRQNDLIAIGRIIYFMATGRKPLSVLEPMIKSECLEKVDRNILNIMRMCFKASYNSIEELIGDLQTYCYINSKETLGLSNRDNKDNIYTEIIRTTRRDRAKKKKMPSVNTNFIKNFSKGFISKTHNIKWKLIYR